MTFERVPDELREHHLTVRCVIATDQPEFCDGYVESFEFDPSDVSVNGYDRIEFADHIPTQCPECGDRILAYNGVKVNFHA